MLRITTRQEDESLLLKLEGKLLEPWLDEVRRVCSASGTPQDRIRLDLAAVTFADADGAALLRELIRNGVAIDACSGFVALLLDGDKNDASSF
jgi:ABC-type transporter Mla MlaB component